MVKAEFYFLFSFKMKNNGNFRDWIFSSFLMVYVYSGTEIDQILSVYITQSAESKSVEIFGLSLAVFVLEAFQFSKF
jgi:hypothetical protein